MSGYTLNRWTLMLVVVLSSLAGFGQQRHIYATTDQRVYISGERIWISGKLLDKGISGDLPLTIYLLNRNAAVVTTEKVLSRDGLFYTSLSLKETLPSDNYAVAVAYEANIRLCMPVMVINPVIPPQTSKTVDIQRRAMPDVAVLPLEISGKEFAARQLVTVKVDTPAERLDYFIQVALEDELAAYADSLFAGWAFSGTAALPETSEAALSLRVRVVDETGRPANGVPVLSSFLSNQADLGYAITDEDGRIALTHPFHFTDPPLVFTPLSETKGLKVLMEPSRDSFALNLDLPPLVLRPGLASAISERVTNTTVGQAYLPAQKKRLANLALDTTDFYGVPDKRYILDNYVRFPDMQEIIQEFVPEVRVRKNDGKAILQVVNLPFKVFFEQAALVMLDGVPVKDIDQLLTLDPLKIFAIDVVGRKFFLGRLQINGIVHYKTYKTDLAGYRLSPEQVVFDFKGLGLPTLPDYPSSLPARVPDLRNTIYWRNPGPMSKGSFSFSTLDARGKYLVSVYGVDDKGKAYEGREEIILK